MDAITTTVRKLNPLDAKVIVEFLTKQGSEFQREVLARETETPIALVRDGSWRIVSWAATHNWRQLQTLEVFPEPKRRRKGFSRVAASMLVANGSLDASKPLAVFASSCVPLAKSLGFEDVRLFLFSDGDWVQS